MKNFTILIVLLFLLPAISHAQNEKEVNSKITKVTVFMTGAQVTREADVILDAGRTTLLFKGISHLLDESTINLFAGNDVTVMTIKHRLDYLTEKKDDPKIKKLKDSIADVSADIEEVFVKVQILRQREIYLNYNRKMETGSQHFDPQKFKELNDFYNTQFTDIQKTGYKLSKQQKGLLTKKLKFINELRSLEQPKADESSIVEVLVKTDKKTSVNLALQYSVTGAGWTPSYDIHVNELNEPMNLIYKANVAQNTGEDWDNVKLVFSNGDPEQNNTLPKVPPYYLSYIDPSSFSIRSNVMYEDAKQNLSMIKEKEIKGKVLDSETGLPLAYATISTQNGLIAFTDVKGEFVTEVAENIGSIQIAYIGYNSVSKNLDNGQQVVYMTLNSNSKRTYQWNFGDGQMAGGARLDMNGNAINGFLSNESNYTSSYNLADDYDGSGSYLSEVLTLSKRSKSYKWGRSSSKRAEYQNLARPIENNISLEFEMEATYSIKSNGKPEILEMTRTGIPASYEYYTIPKVEESAFLVARVLDWSKYKLLPGETNLYLGNTYVGKSDLDVYYVSDTLTISLGRDPSVSVKREKVKEFSGRQFLGSDNIDKRQFRIKVMNNKSTEINVVVMDQVPVSRNKEITVEVGGLSGARYNAETGEVIKAMKISSGKIEEMDIKYTVKYPKGRAINLE